MSLTLDWDTQWGILFNAVENPVTTLKQLIRNVMSQLQLYQLDLKQKLSQ